MSFPAWRPTNIRLSARARRNPTSRHAGIGVSKDKWTAQLTGNNLSNSDAKTNIGSTQFIKSEIPIRPRVLTISLGYTF